MKNLLTYTAAGAMALALLLFPGAALLQAQQPQQTPVPVVVQPTNAQYKVIDISQFSVAPRSSPAAALEGLLNEMAGQGWRLVSISGSIIIMTR